MTEENLPEEFKNTKKEPKLPTKKRWGEMVREYTVIDPTITPEEAFKRVKQIQYSSNPNLSAERREQEKIVENLRNERLRREGRDPQEWAFYKAIEPEEHTASNPDAQITNNDMAKWGSKFPKGIELFVIPGAVSSGYLYAEQTGPISVIPNRWEIYVKLKPEQILEGPPQIEGSKA